MRTELIIAGFGFILWFVHWTKGWKADQDEAESKGILGKIGIAVMILSLGTYLFNIIYYAPKAV